MPLARRLGNALVNMLLLLASIALTGVAIEFAYRYYAFKTFAQQGYPIVALDRFIDVEDVRPRQADDGLYLKNVQTRYVQYTPDNKIAFTAQVRTNNLGFRAQTDYQFAKEPGEYRIAFLGDSMTANVTNDYSWVDIVGQLLNEDAALKQALGASRISVVNLAAPGAGFEAMTQFYKDYGEAFSPDLVVVGFIPEDIGRHFLQVTPKTELGLVKAQTRGSVDISTNGIQARAVLTCHSGPATMENPQCYVASIVELPDGRAGDPSVIGEVRASLAASYLKSRLWTSTYPFSIAAALGEPFSLRYHATFQPKTFTNIFELLVRGARAALPPRESASVDMAVKALRLLETMNNNILMLQIPRLNDLTPSEANDFSNERVSELLRRFGRGGALMHTMFIGADLEDQRSWYNYPHDGHFSNLGSDLFGAAVAKVLREQLVASGPRMPARPEFDKSRLGWPEPRGIQIESATYGANCGGSLGNATRHLHRSCRGQNQCNYHVDHRLIGDPAVGCVKDYRAFYSCPGGPRQEVYAAPPAPGGEQHITLACP